MSEDILSKRPAVVVDREAAVDDPNIPKLGQWYRTLVRTEKFRFLSDAELGALEVPDTYSNSEAFFCDKVKPQHDGEQVVEVLACVTHVGTNYAGLLAPLTDDYESAPAERMHVSFRVHLDEFAERCTHEPRGLEILQERATKHQQLAVSLMEEMQAIAKRLGVAEQQQLPGGDVAALSLRGDGSAITHYKASLLFAKERKLPLLRSQVKYEMRASAALMLGMTFPLEVEVGKITPLIDRIQDRVFRVDLYAGLSEEVVQLLEGRPADPETPIHLFQRRHYMDEECLLHYTAGGMRFAALADFDVWLSQPANLARILPHPRSLVAFRVRREEFRSRESVMGGCFRDHVSFWEEAMVEAERRRQDRLTYIYMRNGEQLFRLNTRIQFDEKLFPDLDQMTLSQALYFKERDPSAPFMSEGEYLERVATAERRTREWEQMSEEARSAWREGNGRFTNYVDDSHERYVLLAPTSVYYDDAMARRQKQMEEHNRLVIVLQGILDRSPVFNPHPRWQLWEPNGFASALTLVHDTSRALTPGDAPDFEAYFAELAKTIRPGTLVIGQDDLWAQAEGVKETNRRHGNWRYRDNRWVSRFRPQGNPGPGLLARVASMSRDGSKCTFVWMKQRQRTGRKWIAQESVGSPMKATFTVETSKLFNVDAYKPGDFRRFYADPRTRAEYLQWAPYMLLAEDFYGGKLDVGSPQVDEYGDIIKTTDTARSYYRDR